MTLNLAGMEENTIASMSRIQDTDMVKEAMNLVEEKNELNSTGDE